MTRIDFEGILDSCCAQLTAEARTSGFKSSSQFESWIYIERALKLIEDEMRKAALRMDDALFVEYWGESVPPEKRIKRWLEKADELASDWIPSKSLFLN